MWALIKLQAKTMIKNPASFMMVIMPVLFIGIMGTSTPQTTDSFTQIVGNVITMNLIAVTMMTFGYTLFEMKKSIIMKRIGSTQITKTRAMMAFFAWSSVVGLFTIFWTMAVASIFTLSGAVGQTIGDTYVAAKFSWGNINWVSFVYGIIVGTLLSLVVGFFMVSISSNLEVFNMISMLYMMLNMFLGGLFLPGQAPWMEYVAYALPHSYIADIMGAAFKGGDVFNAINGVPVAQVKNLFDGVGDGIITGPVSGFTAVLVDGVIITDNIDLANFAIDVFGGSVPQLQNIFGYVNYLGDGFGVNTFAIQSFHSVIAPSQTVANAFANLFVPLGAIGLLTWASTQTFKWDS